MSIWHIYIYTIRVRGRFELNEDVKSQGRSRISVRSAASLEKGVRDGPYGYVMSGCMENGMWIPRQKSSVASIVVASTLSVVNNSQQLC